MTYNAVFVVKAVIRTGIISAVEEAVHLVLIKIHHTHIAVVFLVVDVIRAGFTICCRFFIHTATSYIFH